METKQAKLLVQSGNQKKSVEFSETEIINFSQNAEPNTLQNQQPNEIKLHLAPKTPEELRKKDKAMINQEANALGDQHVADDRKVQFGEGSLIEVSEDAPVMGGSKHEHKVQLNATADNQNPEVQQKNKRMETQEAQTLLNPLPRNEDKKVQFGSASLIETSTAGSLSKSNNQKQYSHTSSDDTQDSRVKEKSKCMELEEAQVLRNPPVMNENKKVQFGQTKLIEVSEEEPPMLSPKEEKTIELYPTPETQNYEVKEKSKKMEIEEAQALRKPSHSKYSNNKPAGASILYS
ncbi:hypothetical protein K7432_003936 [Basidiobolus ranarum]|uniref:Uncharacterized protein n=1 Tax=Basidiobolus ranarum TaxID=34480 RepID=A0ABR2WZ49_9FUNG